MSNWKKTNNNPTASVVQTPYNEFKTLERQANLGKLIDQLPHDVKQTVLRMLEGLLDV